MQSSIPEGIPNFRTLCAIVMIKKRHRKIAKLTLQVVDYLRITIQYND